MTAPNEAISTSKSADIACLFATLSLMLRLAAIYHLEYFISYSSLSPHHHPASTVFTGQAATGSTAIKRLLHEALCFYLVSCFL